jgi:hypothetical protein
LSADVVNQKLATFGEHLDNRIGILSSEMKHTAKYLQSLEVLMARQSYNLSVIHNQFDTVIPNIFHLIKFKTDILSWQKALRVLRSGRLPVSLVPIPQLATALGKLNGESRGHHDQLMVKQSDDLMSRIYNAQNSYGFLVEKDLYIHSRFPLSSDTLFRPYKIICLPIPVHSKEGGYTILSNMPDYLAISRDNTKFIALSHQEFAKCKDNLHNCAPEMIVRSSTDPSCAFASFFDYGAEILSKLCHFNIYAGYPDRMMYNINKTTTFIAGPPYQVTLQCINLPPRQLDLAMAQIISLECGCALISDKFHTVVSVCAETVQFSTHFPVNFGVLSLLNMSHLLVSPASSNVGTTEIRLKSKHLAKLVGLVAKSRSNAHFGEDLAQLIDTNRTSDVSWLDYQDRETNRGSYVVFSTRGVTMAIVIWTVI